MKSNDIQNSQNCQRIDLLLKDQIDIFDVSVENFFEWMCWKIPFRTHLLEIGDYMLTKDDLVYEDEGILFHRIDKIKSRRFNNSIEGIYGTVETVDGIVAKLDRNVFAKYDPHSYPHYKFIEGDNTYKVDIEVFRIVNDYIRNRTKSL